MNKKAFTLIELAAVIIIGGLLVAGVFAGTNMKQAAERKKNISDFKSYNTAFTRFKDKYEGLPGDITDAEKYWPNTTSGDGDNTIKECTDEPYIAWQHLALAHMVSGTYSGKAISNGTVSIKPGVNVPEAPGNQTGYELVSKHTTIDSKYTNMVIYGRGLVNDTCAIDEADRGEYAAIEPSQVYSIDKEIDDSNPYNGMVVGYDGIYDNSSEATRCILRGPKTYNLTSTKGSCIIMYRMDRDLN